MSVSLLLIEVRKEHWEKEYNARSMILEKHLNVIYTRNKPANNLTEICYKQEQEWKTILTAPVLDHAALYYCQMLQ